MKFKIIVPLILVALVGRVTPLKAENSSPIGQLQETREKERLRTQPLTTPSDSPTDPLQFPSNIKPPEASVCFTQQPIPAYCELRIEPALKIPPYEPVFPSEFDNREFVPPNV
jgi:hypothetical protein